MGEVTWELQYLELTQRDKDFIDALDLMQRIYQHIGRNWFVSMEEAEFWYKRLLLPSIGQDSAMQLGMEE